jgi:hypothetical protein
MNFAVLRRLLAPAPNANNYTYLRCARESENGGDTGLNQAKTGKLKIEKLKGGLPCQKATEQARMAKSARSKGSKTNRQTSQRREVQEMKRKAWKKRLAFLCALLIAGQLLSSAAFAAEPPVVGKNNNGTYTVTIKALQPGEQVAIVILKDIYDETPADYSLMAYFAAGKVADLNQVAAGSDGTAVYTTPVFSEAVTVLASSDTLNAQSGGSLPTIVAYVRDPGVDTSALEGTIAAAKAEIDEDLGLDKLYTKSSVDNLKDFIDAAEYVLNNKPEGDLDKAKTQLEEAVEDLVPKGDATELLDAVAEANDKMALKLTGLYKEESFDDLKLALDVFGLLDLDDATQEVVDDLVRALKDGMGAIELLDEIQSASKSLKLLLGNIAGFDGNSDVFVDATALEAAITTANALPVESPEADFVAAYGGVIGAVKALVAKPEYDKHFYSLIEALKRVAEQNYDEDLYTAESWAPFAGAINNAWLLIKATLDPIDTVNDLHAINAINNLKKAENELKRKPAIIPSAKDINIGVYALEDKITLVSERLNPDTDGVAEFEFTGLNFENVGTAQFIVHFPADEVAGIVLENENPGLYDVDAPESYKPAINGYLSYKVWIHAKGFGNTFSVADGEPIVTVKLKLKPKTLPDGVNKTLESGSISLLFNGAEIDYYDTAAATGDIRIAHGRATPSYATTLFEIMSRFDINADGSVNSADIEAVRNLLGAYKLGGVWYMGANPLSAADAARAARANLEDDASIDGVDLTLIKAAWEARYGY